jgi:long-chain acyl-CoA synthetase
LDADALAGWLKARNLPSMTLEEATTNPIIKEHLDKAVERANQAVSRAESIRKYRILLTDFTIENGYLTPSIKVKRSRVLADFADEIDSLYEDTRAMDGA